MRQGAAIANRKGAPDAFASAVSGILRKRNAGWPSGSTSRSAAACTELVEIAKVVDPDYDLSNIRSRVLNDDEMRELRGRLEAMVRNYEFAPDKRSAVPPCRARNAIGAIALPLDVVPHRRAADDRMAARGLRSRHLT